MVRQAATPLPLSFSNSLRIPICDCGCIEAVCASPHAAPPPSVRHVRQGAAAPGRPPPGAPPGVPPAGRGPGVPHHRARRRPPRAAKVPGHPPAGAGCAPRRTPQTRLPPSLPQKIISNRFFSAAASFPSGEVMLCQGPFGLYAKHGDVLASVPKTARLRPSPLAPPPRKPPLALRCGGSARCQLSARFVRRVRTPGENRSRTPPRLRWRWLSRPLTGRKTAWCGSLPSSLL